MKISAKDEYGLRILLRLAKSDRKEGMSIPQLSVAEGLSESYVGKLTRDLRIKGFIQSTRGHKGGYVLCKKPSEITVNEILKALDGAMYDEAFCDRHSSKLGAFCVNSVDCSVRSLWRLVQHTLDDVLDKLTLQDLIGHGINIHKLSRAANFSVSKESI
ncbi:MAG: Rrf2 family transcriptional regulator [Saprospiraceae bacterium]|nr:Rrf2 family transcriptional regulator [Saprospiraceae bacterium]